MLGEKLGGVGTVWLPVSPNFPWNISWSDRDVPPTEFLRLVTTEDQSVVAFLDQGGVVRGLYATPNYQGTLFGTIRPGLIGAEIFRLHPSWKFNDFNATIVDPDRPGFYLKHQEDDLEPQEIGRETFDFIGVFDPQGPYFV